MTLATAIFLYSKAFFYPQAAFYGVVPIDDGATLMMRSGRVKAKFEKLGLLKEILKKVHEDWREESERRGGLKVVSAMGNTCKVIHSHNFQKITKFQWKRVSY